jgi:biopolymer transport protein ExbD
VKPAGGGPPGGINVTPLVDVVLVLLIIFMVVTPLREEALQLRVPDARPPAGAAPPSLVVGVRPDGALTLEGVAVDDGEYERRLGAALRARPAGERAVFFSADDAAPYRRLVLALDGARRAGAETLAVPEPAPAAPRRSAR